MTPQQRLRWFVYRLQNRFRPPENTHAERVAEGAAAPMRPPRWRAAVDRYARMAGGFAFTLILFGIVFALYGELGARVEMPAPAAADVAPRQGARSLAAAASLFSRATELAEEAPLFAPPARARRSAALSEGARRGVRAFLAELEAARGARDPLFTAARALSSTAPGIPPERADDALSRLAAAVGRRQIVLDQSARALRRKAGAAADALAAQAAALDALLEPDASPSAHTLEATYFSARGEAYAWGALLEAAAADASDQRAASAPELRRAIATLARAGAQSPLFFSWGARGGEFQPNHTATLGLELAIAAEELRVFAQR